MDSNPSRLDHNDRPSEIFVAETLQVLSNSLDQRANRSPMKAANEDDAGVGSRRVGKDTCYSQVTREKDRAQGCGACDYLIIGRAGEPDFSDVLSNVTASDER
jgi:hypothetical protein